MSKQINAAVLHGLGEAPRYEPFAEPAEGDGTAVVTVSAAALKPSDRLLASGVRYAGRSPAAYPVVVGTDGVGRLDDGTRVAFFAPQLPYGGMAERTLVRRGLWFAVPDGVDDITAAALTNPGMAAWKALLWEGELAAGETVLVLGATGASGRIATQLARRHGAGRVVAAGRNELVLDGLPADATVRLDRPPDELARALAAEAPYDLVIDYVWGPPAEAFFAAMAGGAPGTIRYVLVGMTAGDVARLPAMTLRAAPLRLIGSGTGRQPRAIDAVPAYHEVLREAAAGEISIDVEPVPLAEVATVWPRADGSRRVVLVP